jgi:carbon starvation protein CstA
MLFFGWLHEYLSGMAALRNDGVSLGGLAYKLVSPRARLILLSFVYFYLLLIAGALGAIIAGALTKLTSGPVAIVVLAAAGAMAGLILPPSTYWARCLKARPKARPWWAMVLWECAVYLEFQDLWTLRG